MHRECAWEHICESTHFKSVYIGGPMECSITLSKVEVLKSHIAIRLQYDYPIGEVAVNYN